MKAFLKLTLVMVALLLCNSLKAQTTEAGNEVFIPITKYITKGDAECLSAWFADNLEIAILSPQTNSSKNQAKQIVKSFFEAHTPRAFDIEHIAGRPNMKYALGTLSAGGESFSVTIFISRKDDDYRIQQLKINRIQ